MKNFDRTVRFLRSLFVIGNLGIGTVEPTNKLDVNGDVRIRSIVNNNTLKRSIVVDNDGVIHGKTIHHIHPIKEVESDYNVLFDDHTILIKNTSIWTLTLPDATTYEGIIFNFKWLNSSSAISRINASNNQKIDGSTIGIVLSQNLKFTRIQSDGQNWFIIN